MKINKIIGFTSVIIFLVLNSVGFFILPDTLVVQVNFSGEASTTLPKFLSLALIMVLGIVIAIQLIIDKPDKEYKRWYLADIIIVIVNVIIFVFNL